MFLSATCTCTFSLMHAQTTLRALSKWLEPLLLRVSLILIRLSNIIPFSCLVVNCSPFVCVLCIHTYVYVGGVFVVRVGEKIPSAWSTERRRQGLCCVCGQGKSLLQPVVICNHYIPPRHAHMHVACGTYTALYTTTVWLSSELHCTLWWWFRYLGWLVGQFFPPPSC